MTSLSCDRKLRMQRREVGKRRRERKVCRYGGHCAASTHIFHRSPHTHTHTEFWHYQDPWNYTHTGNNTSHIPSLSLSHTPLFVSLCRGKRISERQTEGGRDSLTTHSFQSQLCLSLETIKYYFKWKWSFFIFTVNFLYFLLLFVKKSSNFPYIEKPPAFNICFLLLFFFVNFLEPWWMRYKSRSPKGCYHSKWFETC